MAATYGDRGQEAAIEQWKGFYKHAGTWLAVSTVLFVINVLTSGIRVPWFLFPTIAWGLAVSIHGVGTSVDDWSRKAQIGPKGLRAASTLGVIEKLKGVYKHAGTWLAVSTFLFLNNVLTSGIRVPWFLFPTIAWGLAVSIHGIWTLIDVWAAKKLEPEDELPPWIPIQAVCTLMDIRAAKTGGPKGTPPKSQAPAGLSEELRHLLADHEATSAEQEAICDQALPTSAPMTDGRDHQAAKQKAQATAEVDRILASKTTGEILGFGHREAQQREFKRIALLLHPDKGNVSPEDARAKLAWRVALAAAKSSRSHDKFN